MDENTAEEESADLPTLITAVGQITAEAVLWLGVTILFCIVLLKEGPRLKLPRKHPPTITDGTLASPVFVN